MGVLEGGLFGGLPGMDGWMDKSVCLSGVTNKWFLRNGVGGAVRCSAI